MMCRSRYTRWILITVVGIMINVPLFAQKERKYTRQGNRSYTENKYTDSEILYRRALEADPDYEKAAFNLGDALFKQEKYKEAAQKFKSISNGDSEIVPESYYNLANSLLKANKIEESINAYKNALRRDPGNMKAKYNLAYAQDLLQKQKEKQKQQDQQNNSNKDKKDSDSDQNKNKQDEQNKKNDQQQDNSDSNEQNNEQQQQQQQKQQMTKQNAERLLQALAENEKEVQEKVKKAKAAQARVKTLKNW